MKSASNPSVHRGYHSYVGSPAVPGVSRYHIFKQNARYAKVFQHGEVKDTVRLEQWLHAISDDRKNFNDQWVRAAINKSCVGDAADVIGCLLLRTTLDDIIKKFK